MIAPGPRKRMLLVDASNIAYMARFSRFKTDEDLPDDPQGWLEAIAERAHWLMNKLGGYAILFVMDHPPYERKKIYPAYKAEREEDSEKGRRLWKHVNQRIREFLPSISLEGYEADDLIARYCERYGGSLEWDVVICSSDKDLYQLLSRWDNIFIWRTVKGEWAKPWPCDALKLRALIGDDSDNISGVTGEKTAIKLIESPVAKLEEFLDKPYSPKARDERAHAAGLLEEIPKTNRHVYERNRKLMALLGPDVLLPHCPLDSFPLEPTDLTVILSELLGRPWEPPRAEEQPAMGAVA